MPPPIDAVLHALRHSHDELAGIAARLDGAALDARSYCRDWTRAQVFSHLGSGAEIGLAWLRTSLGEGPEPDREAIWARWNALPPEGMAGGFVEHDDRYIAAVEALDPERREQIEVPFVLSPTSLAGVLTFRLHEHAQHSWDVRVSLDPHATLLDDAVPLLLDLPPVMARWAMRPANADLCGPVRLAVRTTAPERHYLLSVAGGEGTLEGVGAGDSGDITGELDVPAEA